jgi:hypothetical protein
MQYIWHLGCPGNGAVRICADNTQCDVQINKCCEWFVYMYVYMPESGHFCKFFMILSSADQFVFFSKMLLC